MWSHSVEVVQERCAVDQVRVAVHVDAYTWLSRNPVRASGPGDVVTAASGGAPPWAALRHIGPPVLAGTAPAPKKVLDGLRQVLRGRGVRVDGSGLHGRGECCRIVLQLHPPLHQVRGPRRPRSTGALGRSRPDPPGRTTAWRTPPYRPRSSQGTLPAPLARPCLRALPSRCPSRPAAPATRAASWGRRRSRSTARPGASARRADRTGTGWGHRSCDREYDCAPTISGPHRTGGQPVTLRATWHLVERVGTKASGQRLFRLCQSSGCGWPADLRPPRQREATAPWHRGADERSFWPVIGRQAGVMTAALSRRIGLGVLWTSVRVGAPLE